MLAGETNGSVSSTGGHRGRRTDCSWCCAEHALHPRDHTARSHRSSVGEGLGYCFGDRASRSRRSMRRVVDHRHVHDVSFQPVLYYRRVLHVETSLDDRRTLTPSGRPPNMRLPLSASPWGADASQTASMTKRPHSIEFEYIRYEQPAERVARIVLARPEAANAQNYQMLSELNQAFDQAARDDSVRVIILAADGKHFSSGHDLRAPADMTDIEPVGNWWCFDAPGAEGYMATEAEMYVGLCWRWRNLAKPTIAQVQGKVIAGGLMLVWPMDLVVCSEDATFSDPVVAFGVNGHEYFTHPYEAGARLAKEMLFTGRAITADEALRHGMVNKVVPRDELGSAALAMAEHIAKRPMLGLTLAKQSVNNTLDAMGMYTAIQSAFGLHHVGHSHNLRLFESLIDPEGLQVIRSEA